MCISGGGPGISGGASQSFYNRQIELQREELRLQAESLRQQNLLLREEQESRAVQDSHRRVSEQEQRRRQQQRQRHHDRLRVSLDPDQQYPKSYGLRIPGLTKLGT